VKHNIKGRHNIILMILPNNGKAVLTFDALFTVTYTSLADIETLQVAKMAKTEDPKGRRTIGI
jgi:hypothetical protein